MGARQKLNTVSVLGILVIASILGCVSHSWLVFIVAAVVLLVLGCCSGDIRPSKHSHRNEQAFKRRR